MTQGRARLSERTGGRSPAGGRRRRGATGSVGATWAGWASSLLVLASLVAGEARAQAGPPATGYIAPPVTGYIAPPPLPGYGVGAPFYGPGGVIVQRRLPRYHTYPVERRPTGIVRTERNTR